MLGLVRPLFFAVALCAAQHAAAVTPGQIDDFEDGTTAGWRIGLSGPGEPVNVPTGGPGGAGDAYLLLTANGAAGPGAKLVAINTEQWAGDYPAAGVVAIEMELANLGATDLALRLYFEDVGPGAANNAAASTEPVIVPSGSGWISAVFPVGAGDLTSIDGDAALALANAAVLRLYHAPTAAFPGPTIAAQLGVDDVRAVPEAARAAASLAAITGVALLQRRRIASMSSAFVRPSRSGMPSWPASS